MTSVCHEQVRLLHTFSYFPESGSFHGHKMSLRVGYTDCHMNIK
jgi:hypothetical protein